jgi:AraC-like DNA-binding protein
MIKVKLLNILVLLIREYDYVNTEGSYIESTKFSQINRAMRYIDEYFTEPISLHDVATSASLNKTYFATLFRQLNGVTPWEYITALRVEKAAELLANSDMSVLEVATACGFNSASNFNRAFRKVTGFTPRDFRSRREP